MKNLFFTLLLMIVTLAVFSRPVDRPPDDNSVKIEVTQQSNFICPVVIDQTVLTVEGTINQTKEQPTILVSIIMKGDTQKGKATTTHLKKSGTERYLCSYDDYNIKLFPRKSNIQVIPRIRGSDNKNVEGLYTI
jgi:hypothetical protein